MATQHIEDRGEALTARRYLLGAQRLGQLVPGAAEAIMRATRDDPRARGGMLAFVHAETFGRRNPATGQVEPGIHSHYLNPEHRAEPEIAVRSVVNRLVAGGHLYKDSAEKLVGALAAPTAGLDGDALIGHVEGHLEDRANWGHLVDEPPVPWTEQRIIDALSHVKDQLKLGLDLGDLARQLAPLGAIGGRSGGQLNLAVARLLAQPHRADLWRRGEFAPDWSAAAFRDDFVEPSDRAGLEAEMAAQRARAGAYA